MGTKYTLLCDVKMLPMYVVSVQFCDVHYLFNYGEQDSQMTLHKIFYHTQSLTSKIILTVTINITLIQPLYLSQAEGKNALDAT